MSRAETSLSRHIFAENFSGVVAQVSLFDRNEIIKNPHFNFSNENALFCKGC